MYGSDSSFSNNSAIFANQVIKLYTASIGSWSYLIISISSFSIMFGTCIAVFDGYLEPNHSLWKEYNLIPICNTVDQVIEASKNNIKFMLHIDTGMNRLGLSIAEANNLLLNKTKKINTLK